MVFTDQCMIRLKILSISLSFKKKILVLEENSKCPTHIWKRELASWTDGMLPSVGPGGNFSSHLKKKCVETRILSS